MPTLLAKDDLPHLVSTRDTRDRLDLIKAGMPVAATKLWADRILYHPGDTAAAHYHADAYHLFVVLSGRGFLHVDGVAHPLVAGSTAIVRPDEVHHFSNPYDEAFSFVEYWAPPPTQTVWTVDGDVCTWAPVADAANAQAMA